VQQASRLLITVCEAHLSSIPTRQAHEDLNTAIELEPRLAGAYWQRHLIHLLKNQQHDALDDLNAVIKINRFDKDSYRWVELAKPAAVALEFFFRSVVDRCVNFTASFSDDT